jgi:hypothetical protein
MSAVIAARHVSLPDSYQVELRVLQAHPCNLLLEGPAAATDAALLLVQPLLREPLVRHALHSSLPLPGGATGCLILRDVAALSASDQARLRTWLQGEGFGVQVVSTTERPLFALIAVGLFDAALYYRLNVLLLRLGPTHSSGSQEPRVPLARGQNVRSEW